MLTSDGGDRDSTQPGAVDRARLLFGSVMLARRAGLRPIRFENSITNALGALDIEQALQPDRS